MKLNEFIDRSSKKHNGKYDYSLIDVNTINMKTGKEKKVKLLCKIHGVFEQLPRTHLYRGHGCRECAANPLYTLESVIIKSRLIHGDRYNYKKIDNGKVFVICQEHGEFTQSIPKHMSNGQGCPKCCSNSKVTQDEFLTRCTKSHGNTYDYSKAIYKGCSHKVEIICYVHGSFFQSPDNHIKGRGCSKCKISKGERHISDFLNENNISYDFQKRFKDCKNIYPLPFDFYIPNSNLCIEFDGIQHYKAIKPFGGTNSFIKRQKMIL